MEDKRKLEIFDGLLDKYLNAVHGYGYASSAFRLKSLFSRDEIVEILKRKYPEENPKVIEREVDKEIYGFDYYLENKEKYE